MTDGRPACTRCFKRPRRPRPTPRGARQRWWPDCSVCRAKYMREWRAGGTTMRLTPDERALMQEIRRAQATGAEVTITTVTAGKHHAAEVA